MLSECQWNAVPAPRRTQVVVQVLHCSGGGSSAAGDTREGTGSRSDGSRSGISVCTRRGRWSAKGNGLAGSRHFSNEASQELADPSLILLGYVPECVFTFFSLNICKWKSVKLLDKCLFNFSVSYEFQITILYYLNWRLPVLIKHCS